MAALVANGLSPNARTPDVRSLLEAAAHHGRGEVLAALVAGAAPGGSAPAAAAA